MHPRSGSAFARLIVTALLLLAVSPVTAPFLTLDLHDWLGGTASPGASLVQPKTVHDEPVPTVAASPACDVFRVILAPAAVRVVSHPGRQTAFLPPLRL